MTEENKHMNEAFKKASDQVKMPYDASFWDAASAKLDDANLDDAFKAAAGVSFVAPVLESTENVDDLFMDAAFVDASSETSASYDPSFFSQFKESEANTLMDEAFQTAASVTMVDYLPKFWSAADKALIAEGLHYEYSAAYWNDAKRLLDRTDRKVFFAKWSAIAAVLLLISFSGSILGWNNFGLNHDIKELSSDSPLNKIDNLNQITSNNINSEHIENSNQSEFETSLNSNHNNSGENNLASFNTSNAEQNINQSNATGELSNGIAQNQFTNNYGMTVTKNPEVSISSPELAPKVYQLDARKYINKIPVEDYDRRDLSISVPLMEINKGQDKPRNMHSISILAQAGVGNRWGSSQFMPSMRSALGIDYTLSGHGLFKNLEFNSSLLLNHIRQNNLGFEDRSTEYDDQGGFHNYWRKIQYKDTWMANLNANLSFRLTPRHKVRIGGGIEYLVGVRSNMSFRDSKISEIDIVNNNWGVKEGISKLDFKLSVGYDFQLTNSIALQLTGNYGFRDRTDDKFLKSPVSLDREMNVMIGVKYTLFRKL